MIILSVAMKPYGVEELYTQYEDSKYASRWGTLYIKFKKEAYSFFIPQHGWVIMRSAIIAFAQVTLLAGYNSH
jgi:hypothetical protein